VLVLLCALLAPNISQASLAGAWQNALDPWNVDGYYFGEYVDWANKYHLADDAGAPADEPVYATANGTVVLADDFGSYQNYGGLILISHKNVDGSSVVSLYGHLDPGSFSVAVGQEVTRGQQIGVLGDPSENGGWPTHIHAGVRKGQYVETPWVYWGYGDSAELALWENPTKYVAAHDSVVEVARVPTQTRDRYETAAGVSLRRYPQAGSAFNVFLASGETHADALAASPLVATYNGPLLLTKPNELPTSTEAELRRVLAAGGSVHLLGGEKTIGPEVETHLKQFGYGINRIAGKNREATAAKIGQLFGSSSTAFIVNKAAFADAVSVSGVAAMMRAPVLLTSGDNLATEVRDYLQGFPGIKSAVLVGGGNVLSQKIESDIRAIGSVQIIERLAGSDRYSTNIAVNKRFAPAPKRFVIATGADYPDALSGGTLAASEQAGLLLTKPQGLTQDANDFIAPLRATLQYALVVGGAAAIDSSFDVSLAQYLNAPINVASVTPPQNQAASANWTAAATTTQSNIVVPVASGFETRTENYRGATVVDVDRGETRGELASPVVVTQLPTNGQTSQAVLAEWFGVTPEQIVTTPSSDGLFILASLPGIFETDTAYIEKNGRLLLFELRLPHDQVEQVLQKLARDNS
jgi:putative cell wall-binding protein